MKRLLLSFALLASGCTMGRPIQQIVVDQNTVLAKSTDEVMLVNLLRAEHNQPMHFALVSQFHGSASLTAGLTLGATFPGGGAPVPITPQASGSYTETPSFDSSIIDSQAFFQGFLRPVDANTVGHFLYDGWNPRLLTYLLVKRFELVADGDYDSCGHAVDGDKNKASCPGDAPALIHKGELIAYLDNNQFEQEVRDGKVTEVNPFVDLVDHFRLTGIEPVSGDDTRLFALKDMSTLGGVDKLDGGSFDVRNGAVYRLGSTASQLILSRFHDGNRALRSHDTGDMVPFRKVDAFIDPAKGEDATCRTIAVDGKPTACAFYVPVSRIFTQGENRIAGKDTDGSTTIALTKTVKGKSVQANVRVVLQTELRSPESTFFMVGEYLRKQHEMAQHPDQPAAQQFHVRQDWPQDGCPGDAATQPMIVATPDKPEHALLSAELDGTRYYIPDSRYACNGTSMKVLTLLEQLFYLQVNSTDKLGLTPTIHVAP